ncbi:MAG: CHRD domain-containing protein, partial [Myxococcaceae bacterium]|nr:CHRD domain-containing protein [Myxococcaceae bacterium]
AGGGTGGSAGGGMADAGMDAGVDAGQDAGQDAGTDAGIDAGPADYSGTYTARLNGAQELPPSGSAAEGTATVTLTRNASDYSVSVSGTHSVTGSNLSAHLHTAIGGLSGNVEVSLNVTAQIALVPGTVGTLVAQTITNQVAQEIGLGRAYVNIHSQGFSGGEIRGQVLPSGAGLMTALLSGADQVPANGYPAGVAALQLVLRPDAGLGLYTGLWPQDVDAVAAHIHQGGPGASTASPFVNFTVNGDGHGATGTIDIGPSSAFVTGNTDGGIYVNVHTSDAGSGLLRGQLIQVLAPN